METISEKTGRYIAATETILRELKYALPPERRLRRRAEEAVALAEQYVKDASYYHSTRDYSTSLTCIAYAEGLLDSLRKLGWLKYEWPASLISKKPRTVVIAGTWDIIHPGHIWLMKKAREHGRLTVIVARDSTSTRIKRRRPVVPEGQRLEVVKSLKPVDEATLGEENHDILKIVERLKPDLILLGPDQHYDLDEMRKELKRRGLRARIERVTETYRKSRLNSSSLIIQEAARRQKAIAKQRSERVRDRRP